MLKTISMERLRNIAIFLVCVASIGMLGVPIRFYQMIRSVVGGSKQDSLGIVGQFCVTLSMIPFAVSIIAWIYCVYATYMGFTDSGPVRIWGGSEIVMGVTVLAVFYLSFEVLYLPATMQANRPVQHSSKNDDSEEAASEFIHNSDINSGAKFPKRYPWKKSFIIFLILLICVVYPFLKMRWAKNKVESFCSSISIGMTVQGLEQRAKDYGLKVRMVQRSDSENPRIIIWEGWAFSRWFCEIEHSNGKVVKKEDFVLD